MASLYWIEESLPGLLPCFCMFAAVGLPWAYAAIPRREWRCYALIGALALALGPAWLTGWMLVLGIIGAQLDLPLLTPASIITGSAFIGLLGAGLAWRKRRRPNPQPRRRYPLAFDEKLIIALIILAVGLRWLHTAYFPFTAYDALWVYGYQGRLYFLEGLIPNSIGYYPPFLSLQFAFVQTLIGEVNDHAARMVLPLMHIGSILAAYLLGQRLASRRVGLIVAALWSLHPYVGQWSYRGDLEIPLTFSFTLAAVFFLDAWREDHDDGANRRHLAILAGLMLGIALFTKPTAGAFIWAALLFFAGELLRTRLDPRRWLPRFKVALWTGLACLPLGAIWYARNLLLGHDAVTLPKAVWLTRALRNGDYLAPLLIAVVVAWLALALRRPLSRRELALGAVGLALLLTGALASNSALFPARVDPPASYIQPAEALMMLAGLALAGYSARRSISIGGETARLMRLIAWALLLALPYFLTFFFSYSYHYRLGFAILPLLCLPIAIALSRILDRKRMRSWGAGRRGFYAILLTLLCLPGILAVMTDVNWSALWLRRDDLDSDFKKYEFYNPSLMQVVSSLEDYLRQSETSALVLAPGEERLPFFFPQLPIHDDLATTLAELEDLGATHIVYGAKAREAYLDAGIDPRQTQLVAALGRHDLFEKVKSHYHGVFSYELYQVSDISQRWQLPTRFAAALDNINQVVFADQLRLYAYGVYTNPPEIYEKLPITFEPTWQVLRPISRDYEFVLQVRHPNGELGYEWRLSAAPHRHAIYRTSLWSEGEYVNNRHIVRLDRHANLNGDGFTFWFGIWDLERESYLPLEIDGEAAGEFHQLPGVYQLVN